MAFNMAEVAETLKKKLSKTDPDLAASIGVGTDLPDPKTGECIEMPEWWQKATNTKGLYFGRTVMIAGPSDSGKTSAAITAMKAAQDSGCAVIYVETEGKTTTRDLESWGVDASQIILIKQKIAEKAFQTLFATIDAFYGANPKARMLVVFDSIGNVVSLRDSELDFVEESSAPGGKGKINRLGINRMIIEQDLHPIAFFIVNYSYATLGSHGRTNAGGEAVNFFSSLTYQTSRVKWLEKTVDGQKVRKGAIVKYTLYKNHIDKENPGLKEIFLKITSDGIELMDSPGD